MKIEIPKVIVPVDMGAYAPELTGKALHVWVNPPREKLNEYDNLVADVQEQETAKARQVLLDEPKPEKPETSALLRTFERVASMLNFRRQSAAQGLDERLLAWFADLWSYGPADTGWTVAELRQLEGNDPTFLKWMIESTWQARKEHVERKKKF
jgi:hypothetical protein